MANDPFTGQFDQAPVAAARFIIGIDLGTTNSAFTYVDTRDETGQIQTFAIPQLVAAGTIEPRDSLPSFHYEAAKGEMDANALGLPWGAPPDRRAVGTFARDHGAGTPGRLVVSAKSWLSHAGVDRQAEILPWHGASDVTRQSPTTISSRYLEHLRLAWNHAHPKHPLEEQDVVLTVPASFDEVARELTVEAARKAGLPRLHLIEEPQAAFYSWMQGDKLAEMQPGEITLVCDIGGGTTDLTLIQAEEDNGFRRLAVGDHLILGGDNLDLALAKHVEQAMGKDELTPTARSILVRRCREAKETLLGDNAPESAAITLPARGSKIIGGSRQVTVTREEATALLTDGFLPDCALSDTPATRASGFQEFSLPYAPDPGITRYVAAFLRANARFSPDEDVTAIQPDYLLFNGGFFASPVLRERLLKTLSQWFDPDNAPEVLPCDRLDLAVARGASAYGLARRGQGTRISGGLPRTYYLGIGNDNQALCLLPSGMEEGQQVDVTDHSFQLRIREPVLFPIYTSSLRTTDAPGELIDVDPEQMTALPPVKTVVRSGKKKAADTVEVSLHARLTELGTIEVWFSETKGQRTWRLQFDIRAAVETDRDAEEDQAHHAGILEEEQVSASRKLLHRTFDPGGKGDPAKLIRDLEAALDVPRDEWPPALLRNWWELLLTQSETRKSSAAHEARWLNLLGFCLRPGYGFPLDDWRVQKTWELFHNGLAHPANEMCRAEWWILWRRIAGGLSTGQQQALAAPLLKAWRAFFQPGGLKKAKLDHFRFGDHESAEVWRLLGSLEQLSAKDKRGAGEILIQLIKKKGDTVWNGSAIWALGRIGARVPAYGLLNTALDPDVAEAWLDVVLAQSTGKKNGFLAAMLLARKTEDRYRDIPPAARQQVLNWLDDHEAPEHYRALVETGGILADEEQDRAFGEALPPGLHLVK